MAIEACLHGWRQSDSDATSTQSDMSWAGYKMGAAVAPAVLAVCLPRASFLGLTRLDNNSN